MVKAGIKFSLIFVFIGLLGVCCPLSNLPIFQENKNESSGSPFLTQSAAGLLQKETPASPTATTVILSSSTPTIQISLTPEIFNPGITQSSLYDISETIRLRNDGPGEATKISLRIVMVRSISPYQEVLESSFDPPYDDLETDEFGNEYAVYELNNIPVGSEIDFTLSYSVKVNELKNNLGDCQGDLPNFFTQAEEFVEADAPLIIQLADDLSQGKSNACEVTRSFYDYIAGSFTYKGYTEDSLGALWAFENNGGDCTEFSDSLIALSRAADIPARFLEGVTCCTENGYSPGQNKHDWLEIYLPGSGWVPMDPTWGRSSYDRETYFAGMTSDHIILTQGRSPEPLNGYHYYSYRYWWGETSTSVSSEETWSILRSYQ